MNATTSPGGTGHVHTQPPGDTPDGLDPLRAAALPAGTEGAWIAEAIDLLRGQATQEVLP